MKIKKIDLYILAFLLVNVVQAVLTPIIEDEAYYWMFSKHLDFGYFDHPPMVAYIIKLGTLIFSDSLLGVRFTTIIFSALTLKIIWKLIPEDKKTYAYSELLFLAIALSMPLFNIYGFITTPDTALLFFSALFLLALNHILKKESFLNILFFGASAALLIYSKYHGGVVILLAVLFKTELLKKWSTYMAGFIALMLISPHIYWQYQNDFVTFDYHLFQRTSGGFKIKNVINYVLATLVVLNPALIVLLFLNFKKIKSLKVENKFIVQMFIGFLSFFFLYSFRSKIEPHWVAFCVIPMSILIYNMVVSNLRLVKQMKYIGIVSISLFLILRVLIVLDLPLKSEFHREKADYFSAISKLANGKKVVFVNSYQRAAKFTFYEGKPTFSTNNVYYRKNHYDLLNVDETFNNEKILLIGAWPDAIYDSLYVGKNDLILHHIVENYPVYNRLKASFVKRDLTILDTEGEAEISIYNPYSYTIDLERKDLPYTISFCLYQKKDRHLIPLEILNRYKQIKPNTNSIFKVRWYINNDLEVTGKCVMRIAMTSGGLYPLAVSKTYDIELPR